MPDSTDGAGRGGAATVHGTREPVPDIHRGLADVVVDSTAIAAIDPATQSLTYRGYPVEQLARQCSFEEVAYLLWNGELPEPARLHRFLEREREHRRTDRPVNDLLALMPQRCPPMDVLRTVVGFLGARDPDEDAAMVDPGGARGAAALQEGRQQDEALRLMALMPTVVAADMRRRRGLTAVAPDERLGFAANFLHMCHGEVPDPELARAFETSLILYAEHSFNASAFTARVITSTQSDLYSAVTGAVGALKGPLHGGANEAAMRNLLEIGSPERVDPWLRGELAAHRKVMGFGHRVYKNGDSRVPTMRAALGEIAERRGGHELLAVYDELERAMADATGLKPNVDYPVGLSYYLLGIDIVMFTPIFAMARIAGWGAHIIEQRRSNHLIRPLAHYEGPPRRDVPVAG
ncbi:bifunctional 2-methylcitrate synthase/citrate synthase [Tomitella gaofuii]|uniref:bifunctional 2-methylcitrate synthase/citrate synthase n=1 Tax=Tomitella gaofuii TaxID=2760083 RepID=UPI0015FA020C|nr:bifunctional 2-methylcitrate synthase/citrate synthase [Tomitella gaofuii]